MAVARLLGFLLVLGAVFVQWQGYREQQTMEVSLRDARVVVCGDFNCDPAKDRAPESGHRAFDSLHSRGFVDALAGTHEGAWPTHFPSSTSYGFERIDLIFVSAALRACVVPYSGRVLSEGAPWGDHVPVEVTLAI